MVHNCSVYGCLSTAKHNKDLRFHRFPRDARLQLWIDACRRPDLKDKNIDQLYNMYVCSLHFEEWMYMKKKLKSAAFPVLNLPSALIYPVSTQMEHSGMRGVRRQIDVTSVAKTVAASDSTSAQTSQNTKEITNHTPRKRKLSKEMKTCAKKLKATNDIKSADITPQQFLQGCDKFLTPNLSKIVKSQIDLKRHYSNNRYSKKFKMFCLNIYYSSPYAYKFLSRTLRLPSKSALATFSIPVSTKISDYIWRVLSQIVKHLSPLERECTFCMNEMRLKCSLFYDTHRDKIVGLHDTDDNQNPHAARYAFTIMLRGILGDWKQVVGYAFITTSQIDESLGKWIVNTIKRLLGLGFKIRAVVSNQQSDFVIFSDTKGISNENPFFEIDGNKIYYIFDVPHLIDCVRNNLMNYNFEFNGKTASWDDVYKCYELDKQNDSRCGPKLTQSPNNFQKQKVPQATRVLSESVKAAMGTYIKSGDLNPQDGTLDFIDIMDKLFDLLNCNNFVSPNPYNKPYRGNELQRNLLLKADNLFSSLKVRQKDTAKDVTTTIKFIDAFSVTIHSIIQLYDDLKKESGLDEFYLLTGRLNNDCLKYFFGIIQQASGTCREPTCIQFERAFQKSFLCQTFKLCSETNCADDLDNVLSQFSDFTRNESVFTRSVVTRPTSGSSSTKFDIPEENSLLDICGYVLKRCLDKHKCLSIINYASSNNNPAGNTSGEFFGELQVPPGNFVAYFNELEAHFNENFRLLVGNNISEELFDVLSKVKFKSKPCACFPQSFMIRLFIQMRIHVYIIKFNNDKLKTSKNKVELKNQPLQHIDSLVP